MFGAQWITSAQLQEHMLTPPADLNFMWLASHQQPQTVRLQHQAAPAPASTQAPGPSVSNHHHHNHHQQQQQMQLPQQQELAGISNCQSSAASGEASCPHCAAHFGHLKNLKRHIKNAHKDQQQPAVSAQSSSSSYDRPRLACQACNQTFSNNGNLLRHFMKTHDVSNNATVHKPQRKPKEALRCQFCKCQFSRKDNLLRHTVKAHASCLASASDDNKSAAAAGNNFGFEPHAIGPQAHTTVAKLEEIDTSCLSGIDKVLLSLPNMAFDMNIDEQAAASRREATCPTCGLHFLHARNLRRHIANMHKDGRSEEGDAHPRRKSQAMRVSCNFCAATFASNGNLLRHLINVHGVNDAHGLAANQLHHAQQQSTCTRCGVRFMHARNLQRHMKNVHKEELVVAPSTSNNKAHLQRQLEIPPAAVPGASHGFPCHVCQLSLSSKGNLSRHLLNVHGMQQGVQMPTNR